MSRPWTLWISAFPAGALLFSGLLALTGCGEAREDPVLALSSQEALELGKDFLEQKKYYKARQHLVHAFEIARNSAGGREALLLAADTFFLQGNEANYIQAEAKYRDYLNRFPISDKAPYVQFQIGNSLALRIKRADRDQSVTAQAERAYREVLAIYPTSEYAAKAREQIKVVRNRLAEHEYTVGRFYHRYGLVLSAIQRYEGLLEQYPDYEGKDRVYHQLVVAHNQARQAVKALDYLDRLKREFPDSDYLKDIPRIELPEEAETAVGAQGEVEGDEDRGEASETAGVRR